MARYIQTRDNSENAWEQFSVFKIAKFLHAKRGFTIDQTIDAIRDLCDQEEADWDEDDLREILERADKT